MDSPCYPSLASKLILSLCIGDPRAGPRGLRQCAGSALPAAHHPCTVGVDATAITRRAQAIQQMTFLPNCMFQIAQKGRSVKIVLRACEMCVLFAHSFTLTGHSFTCWGIPSPPSGVPWRRHLSDGSFGSIRRRRRRRWRRRRRSERRLAFCAT